MKGGWSSTGERGAGEFLGMERGHAPGSKINQRKKRREGQGHAWGIDQERFRVPLGDPLGLEKNFKKIQTLKVKDPR